MTALQKVFEQNEIDQIAVELDSNGFVCLPDVLSRAWLEKAQEDVRAQRNAKNLNVFTVLWPSKRPGSPTEELVSDTSLSMLIERLASHARPSDVNPDEVVFNVLRIVDGGTKGLIVPALHYDASTLTVLVPILIPEGPRGTCGELIVCPNRRPYRNFLGVNLIEKMIVQSKWYHRKVIKKPDFNEKFKVHDLKPGSLYMFWGYRTYHGNYGCSPGSFRASLLLHFGNPHGRSSVLRIIRNLSNYRISRLEMRRKSVIK